MIEKKTERGIATDIRAAWEATDKASLAIQCLVCLAPMVAGAIAYDAVPDMMAIHWGLGNEPNGWAPREFVLFGLPVMMALMQLVLVLMSEGAVLSARRDGDKAEVDAEGKTADEGDEERRPHRPKALALTYWIIPVVTVVLYAVTVAYGLGRDVPVSKVALGLLALLLILSGNYAQKMPYSIARRATHPTPKSERGYRRYARICSWAMIAAGFACLMGMFFV